MMNSNVFGAEAVGTLPIVSDGGSSSYYDRPIPLWLVDKLVKRADDSEGMESYIKTEELIEVLFDNDFRFGTLLKALVRAHGVTKGAGKAGNSLKYELNKIRYYANNIEEQETR